MSILVSEDHPLVRVGAQRQLEGRLCIPVEACCNADIERRLQDLQPDVLVLGLSGSEDISQAVARYRSLSRSTRIVVIPPLGSEPYPKYGGVASVSRRALHEQLPQVVRGVLRLGPGPNAPNPAAVSAADFEGRSSGALMEPL
jgi:hypothetical protein